MGPWIEGSDLMLNGLSVMVKQRFDQAAHGNETEEQRRIAG